MTALVRIKFTVYGQEKPSTRFARKRASKSPNTVFYELLKNDGDWQHEFFIGQPADILEELPARMNGKYERLEVVK
jgi:hypothetical protein